MWVWVLGGEWGCGAVVEVERFERTNAQRKREKTIQYDLMKINLMETPITNKGHSRPGGP